MSLNLNIPICNSSEEPIHKQVADEIKAQILSGELKPKEALPSVHLLARALHISVSTTKLAYDELEQENLIYTIDDEVSFVKNESFEREKEDELSIIKEKLKGAASLGRTYNIPLKDLLDMLSHFYKTS